MTREGNSGTVSWKVRGRRSHRRVTLGPDPGLHRSDACRSQESQQTPEVTPVQSGSQDEVASYVHAGDFSVSP